MGQRRAEENDQGTSIPKMQPRTDLSIPKSESVNLASNLTD